MDNVKKAFEGHQTEIKRRNNVSKQETSHTFDKVEGDVHYPFVISEQKYVLFSLSSIGFAPRAEDPSNPAVRIYGAFDSTEEANFHAQLVLEKDPSCSLMLDETHKWIVAPSTEKNMQDVEYIQTHTNKILKKYEDIESQHAADFHKNVSEQEINHTTNRVPECPESKCKTDISNMSRARKNLPSGAEVRRQQLAVVSFLPDRWFDKNNAPEFIFRVYAMFEHEDDANKWVRNVCGDEVKDHDVFVVNTCEWLHPQKLDKDKIKSIYRSNELDKILTNHKDQPNKVKQFEEWRQKEEPEESVENLASSLQEGPRVDSSVSEKETE